MKIINILLENPILIILALMFIFQKLNISGNKVGKMATKAIFSKR